MRYVFSAFGLVLASAAALLPATASAQTAADVARQVWPHGAPAFTGTAPRSVAAIGGFDHGVQREVWLRYAPLTRGSAPSVRVASAFTGTDLAASLGGSGGAIGKQAPYLTAEAAAKTKN